MEIEGFGGLKGYRGYRGYSPPENLQTPAGSSPSVTGTRIDCPHRPQRRITEQLSTGHLTVVSSYRRTRLALFLSELSD